MKENKKSIIMLYAKGLSAYEISQVTNFSMRQIYRFLEKNNIPRRTPAVQNKIRFEKQLKTYTYRTKLSLQDKFLEIAALMLYLGEGAKTGKTVDFTNTSPQAIQIFFRFLNDICGVQRNRIKFYLYCFSSQKLTDLIKYWTHLLKVNKKQFTKPYIRKNKNSSRIAPYGVLHIRYSDKKLLRDILDLISKISLKLNT